MILLDPKNTYTEDKFKLEEDFEKEIISLSHKFFGAESIFIDSKKRIGSESLGTAVPDGFLFDMSDPKSPEFYLVEFELVGHDFYNHIFPQITKFFAFFKNSKKQKELVEKLFSTINTEDNLKKQFKKYLGEQEIFKFLNDLIYTSQNILLIIDGEKSELPEIIDTYTDTWGKMVKVLKIKKFICNNNAIYSMSPEFEAIQYSTPTESESQDITITEEFHLEDTEDLYKGIYKEIKSRILSKIPEAIFNPQKYYISIKAPKNIVYIKFRKKKIVIIVMLPEDEIKNRVKKNPVKSLSEGVQNFYNGPCARVELHSSENLDELIDLISHTYDTLKEK